MRVTALILATAILSTCGTVHGNLIWTWDSGTTEGWSNTAGGDILTVSEGRDDTLGLLVTGSSHPVAVFPSLEVTRDFDPGILVGGALGDYLPMKGEIWLDADRLIPAAHGDYVLLTIYGDSSLGRFMCYPFDNLGTVEELGDGWFRYHLVNRSHAEYEVEPSGDSPERERAGQIYLEWNYTNTPYPIALDNLTIIPEPATLLLLGVGGAVVVRRRSTRCL